MHKAKQLVVDSGSSLITIDAGYGQNQKVIQFVAYANGVSLRSTMMALPSVRDRFLACIWAALQTKPVADTDSVIRTWIGDTLSQLQEGVKQ